MRLSFAKMQALGNDFVVLDATTRPLSLGGDECRRLADRRLGVGCDQILLVTPAPSPDFDFGYRIYNADGSEVSQCGNGARALALFIARRGLSAKRQLRVATDAAQMELELLEHDQVRVNMGLPNFSPEQLPLRQALASHYQLQTTQGDVQGGAVSMGNPHFVLPVADVEHAPVADLGAEIAVHKDFPAGVNVGFAQRMDDQHIRLRVYERGVGETPACGSGACAAMVVLRHWGELDSQAVVDLPGGSLRIAWAGEGQPVYMEGPAVWVFEGDIEL